MVAIFQEREDYFELYWDVEPLPLSYVQFNWTGSQWQMQKALDIKLSGIKANLLVGSPVRMVNATGLWLINKRAKEKSRRLGTTK